MSKGRKITVSLMRAFFGEYGVDCFIMKANKMGAKRIVWSVVLMVLCYASIIPYIGWIVALGAAFASFVKFIYFLVTGLKMLKAYDEEITSAYNAY